MNIVSLLGRLTADPELRHTQSGTAVARFTVAVDRRTKPGEERQADFINVVAWNQRAEMISKYFSKGQRIGITGSIRTGSYTAQDGSKRYTTEVWADSVDFCESKNSSSSYDGGNSYGNGYNNNNSYSSNWQSSYRPDTASTPAYTSGDVDYFADMPTDEDLPF